MRPQGLQMGEIRGVMGNASGSPLMNHLRVQGPQRSMLTEPVLSPILTDTEISPLHRTGMGSAPGNLTFGAKIQIVEILKKNFNFFECSTFFDFSIFWKRANF